MELKEKHSSQFYFWQMIREKYGFKLAMELVRDFGGIEIYIPQEYHFEKTETNERLELCEN
jgi:Mor family transcriptional regulator